ncbi:unnamed protein product [Sphagnum tenellum]
MALTVAPVALSAIDWLAAHAEPCNFWDIINSSSYNELLEDEMIPLVLVDDTINLVNSHRDSVLASRNPNGCWKISYDYLLSIDSDANIVVI